jgi:hypothetical protein
MFSLMIPTVSSICAWMAAVFGFPARDGSPEGFEDEPPRGRYGSYGSDLRREKGRLRVRNTARMEFECQRHLHGTLAAVFWREWGGRYIPFVSKKVNKSVKKQRLLLRVVSLLLRRTMS